MQLPRKYHNRVLYALERTKALRSGEIDADPRWLQCIDRVLADVPDEGMRAFFDQFFQTSEHRAASGQNDPPIQNVRRQLRRRLFQNPDHRFHNLTGRLTERFFRL